MSTPHLTQAEQDERDEQLHREMEAEQADEWDREWDRQLSEDD